MILEALPWGPPQNLYFALEVPAWGELNSLRLRDTDLLESVGINTFTGLSLDHFEGSKPYQLNHLSLFHTNFDALMTAVTALSALALLVSFPSCFWTASTNSILFMINDAFCACARTCPVRLERGFSKKVDKHRIVGLKFQARGEGVNK